MAKKAKKTIKPAKENLAEKILGTFPGLLGNNNEIEKPLGEPQAICTYPRCKCIVSTSTSRPEPDCPKGLPQDDLTIPPFLKRKRDPDAPRPSVEELSGGRREWAPIRDYKNQPPAQPPAIFVADPSAPVQVNVRGKDGTAPTALASYANMAEFEVKHDQTTYPVVRTGDFDGRTIVLVRATPWAGREKAPANAQGARTKREPGQLGAKAQLIADLLLRPEGCTTKDVLEATGWPAVSMPGQAKIAGLNLRKEKVDGVTRYWGSKT